MAPHPMCGTCQSSVKSDSGHVHTHQNAAKWVYIFSGATVFSTIDKAVKVEFHLFWALLNDRLVFNHGDGCGYVLNRAMLQQTWRFVHCTLWYCNVLSCFCFYYLSPSLCSLLYV